MRSKLYLGALCALPFLLLNGADDLRNLLLNPDFNFHSFQNHRVGRAGNYVATYVPGWNASGAEVLKVFRDSHIPAHFRPPQAAPNGVRLSPGAKFSQFVTLPEINLIPGDRISFSGYIYQDEPQAVEISLQLMKIDSEDGTWCPQKDFGFKDKRVFARHGRGELVPCNVHKVTAPNSGMQAVKIENFAIQGHFTPDKKSHSKDMNVVGLKLEYVNHSKHNVWIFTPALVKSAQAQPAVGTLRAMPEFYRHIPRTMQKLWKGEPLHIIIMGSSIDRGSANPPIYPYNENPQSPDFKNPLCDAYDGKFSTALLGYPELDKHLAQPRHFYSYGGRLKVELMKKFNYPADKILVNFMACDGSCIGESHSGLRDYCELKLAPAPDVNGHKSGASWQELYPALFARPEGPRPDLVIYGSGANEKTDTPHEVAVFEGAIRFIQKNYPGTEFLFSVFQNYGGYTPNAGDLQALALRYGIPYLDYGIIGDRICRNANRHAVVDWGHPQTAVHYLWFKQIEKAFECADPISAGFPQIQLPERAHVNTINWEGEMQRYTAPSPRLFRANAAILDDAAFNVWGETGSKKRNGSFYVDGREVAQNLRSFKWINVRNSLFRHGNLTLGNRHIIELTGPKPKITALDCKVVPERRWIGVESAQWQKPSRCFWRSGVEKFASQTGFPYGRYSFNLQPGESTEISVIGNFFSVAWVDQQTGGQLKLEYLLPAPAAKLGKISPVWTTATNSPFVLKSGEKIWVENRKAVAMPAYGVHRFKLTALQAPVKLLGLYSYDTRSNRQSERVVRGTVSAGETVSFNPQFQATPIVTGVPVSVVTPSGAKFSQAGTFTAVGE